MAASTPTHHGRPCRTTSTAATAPVSATTDPTDRSMCPPMMMITMPMARMRMYENCRTSVVMFRSLSSSPLVSTENSATISTKAM